MYSVVIRSFPWSCFLFYFLGVQRKTKEANYLMGTFHFNILKYILYQWQGTSRFKNVKCSPGQVTQLVICQGCGFDPGEGTYTR